MNNLYLFFSKLPELKSKICKKVICLFLLSSSLNLSFGQIYQHNFGTSVISGYPYTIAPAIFDPNLANSSWANSTSSWTSFSGSSGQAIALNNSTGTPTISITFDIAAGYQADITGFSFWRQRSSTGASSWSITINGAAVGSGTAPTSGTNTGLIPVSSAYNLTGTVTITITLSGASGTGTFRIDDFTLNGSVTPGATLSAASLTGFGNICTNTTSAANTFTITGTGLSSAPVVLGALSGFTYSKDNNVYASTLSLTQPGGSYSQLVYVRFSPLAVQSYDGSIPLSGGGATATTIDAAGNGVNSKPTLTNGTAGNIATNTADINASITSTGCTAISSYGAEYSVTPGFANGTGTQVAGGALSGGNFIVNLTGLTPAGQVFYFHTYAANAGGIAYGIENSFTLLSTTPVLSVPAAGAGSLYPFGSICINTAYINSFNLTGSVLNGSNITIGALSRYSYSIAATGPFSNSLVIVQGGSGYNYSGGVLSGCTIYVRFIPTAVQSYNGSILVSGGGAPAISVTATGSGVNSPATVSTGIAYSITSSSAILPATVTADGCGVILGYGVEYSTAPFTPGTGTQVAGSNLSGQDFSVSLSLLSSNTSYYYYAYVTNAGGLSYGSSKTFSTFPVPSKLVIVSVSPVSPTALTPFSVTVQAQDNSGNPVDVTINTGLSFTQTAGSGIFTFPNSPLPAGTIPFGSNTITITDLSYDISENNVGIKVTASSGMTGLGTSVPKIFNVIAYVGPSTFIWAVAGGSAWLTGSNWNTGTAPGSSTPGFNQHLASFTSAANLNLTAVGGCGLNMNAVGGAYDAGAIYFTNTYAFNHVNNIVPLGNSSTTQSGTLTLWGAGVNNVGGITGNNFTSLLIGNYMNTSNTSTLEIKNTIGSGSQNMTLSLGASGSIVAGAGRSININTVLAGSQSLAFAGGGTFTLTPSGAASVNSFTGAITVSNGMLITGNTGAFSNVSPNIITLGSTSNAGVLRLNGHNVTIGGLSTSGTAGNLNIVDNGNAPATLTINNGAGYTFNGSLKDGVSGPLSLIKTGAGIITLTGLNTFTGLTTVNAGAVILARSGGATIPPGNSVTVNGSGMLRISADQTIKNITLATGGTLRVDAGIVLTVTGNYTAGSCNILNFGTIILNGVVSQSFPGATAAVSNMNNLTIDNPFGVNLNTSLNIGGTLNLVSGSFGIGVYTLTLNNPLVGNMNNFIADNTSSLVIAGTTANVNIPGSVTQLKNLTVSNSTGTTLQGDLNVSTVFFITNTAGIVDAGTNKLYGTANTTMTGGTLMLARNTTTVPELSGVYVLTGGAIIFNGVGTGSDAQTIRAVNYFNLTSAANGDRVLSASGTIGVANIFTPNVPGNTYFTANSTIDYNKAGPQNIAGFKYYNLTLSGGSFTKTLSGNIELQGTLALAANIKIALGNFNATLKSDATNTANIAIINTPNSITYGSGKFIIERYIPTGVAHGKSWQLLSVPVSGTQSVNGSWQEGNTTLGNTVPNFGTTISSERPGATSRGYDFYTPSGPSIKTYNSALDTWDGIDDGITNTPGLGIANRKGYMIFVRGDRSVQTSATPANITTLRTAGKIYAPGADAPPSTTVGAGKFETVGNPYASALDFTNVHSISPGIDDKYYIWDPLLPGSSGYGYGGYQLLSSVNMWKPVPGGTTNYPSNVPYSEVQSGQAFFVYATGGGTVNFAETNKLSGSRLIYRHAVPSNNQYMRSYLYGATGIIADGNVVAFNNSFINNFDENDAVKPANAGENFSIKAQDKILFLDARPLVLVNDTVFYNLANLNTQEYQFRFAPESMDAGLSAFLVDNFKRITIPVSTADSTFINFDITSDPASKAANRFYLVFRKLKTGQQPEILISAIRNSNGSVDISWNMDDESGIDHYEVEKGADKSNVVSVKTLPVGNKKDKDASYTWNDTNPGQQGSFYRVKAITIPGTAKSSHFMKVEDITLSPDIRIYPNPVVNKIINISFVNKPSGNYNIQLINKAGQVVLSRAMKIAEDTPTTTIAMNLGNIVTGIYNINIIIKENRFVKEIIVQ